MKNDFPSGSGPIFLDKAIRFLELAHSDERLSSDLIESEIEQFFIVGEPELAVQGAVGMVNSLDNASQELQNAVQELAELFVEPIKSS